MSALRVTYCCRCCRNFVFLVSRCSFLVPRSTILVQRRGGVRPPDSVLRQFLTFTLLSFIPFASLSILTFCRAKSYKNARHKFRKSFKALARELPCNITHPPFTYRSCLSFQSREQKNSLHAFAASYGAHAQTLLFFFLYWN